MRVGLGAGHTERQGRQIKALERELGRIACGDGRRNDRRQRRHAADTGFEADRPIVVVRSGRWLSVRDVAVAKNAATSTVNRFSCSLGGAKACDQTGKRNCISGDQRNNAPLQSPLREFLAHDSVFPPLDWYKQLIRKEIPPPAATYRNSRTAAMRSSAVYARMW